VKVSFKIALRYIFAKKSINVINIISGISTIGITIATAALIIILSVFNGLEEFIISRFNTFNPELKVSIEEGKFFDINDSLKSQIQSIKNIKAFSFVMEDYAAIKVGKKTHPFPIKGVDNNYLKVCGIDTMLLEGEFLLKNKKGENMAVVGYEAAQQLSIGIGFVAPIVIYAPKRSKKINTNPMQAFNKKYLYPSAIYGIDESTDNKIILPLELVQSLFEAQKQATDIEINLYDNSQSEATKKELKKILGNNFSVKNQIEQNSFYKIINSERLMIYLILGFVLLIATFNIIATLTMLIVDKKKDFISLQSIGLSHQEIKMIFLFNAWITSIIGGILGLFLGGLIAYLQIKFSIVSFGDHNYIIDAYPISIEALDFIKVFILLLVISLITSLLPIRNFSKNYLKSN